MCLISGAVYRIRGAEAIFRIERKHDQKIAKNSKLFYTKYGSFTSNHCGILHGTLRRIVSKYIFVCACFRRFTIGSIKTRQLTLWAVGLITTNHDMRHIRLTSVQMVKKWRRLCFPMCMIRHFFRVETHSPTLSP